MDIIPKLNYVNKSGKIVELRAVAERIDSLKPDQKEKIDFMFTGGSSGVPEEDRSIDHECIMKNFLDKHKSSFIELTVLYKNALGACFKEKSSFDIWFFEGDEEKIKSCLKLLGNAKIDFAEDIRKIDTLLERADREGVQTLLKKMNSVLFERGVYANRVFA